MHVTESIGRLGVVETLIRQLLSGDPESQAFALLKSKKTTS